MQIMCTFFSGDRIHSFKNILGTSLVVQWLGLRASTAGGTGLIPGQGTKILHAAWPKKKILKMVFNPKYLGEQERRTGTQGPS